MSQVVKPISSNKFKSKFPTRYSPFSQPKRLPNLKNFRTQRGTIRRRPLKVFLREVHRAKQGKERRISKIEKPCLPSGVYPDYRDATYRVLYVTRTCIMHGRTRWVERWRKGRFRIVGTTLASCRVGFANGRVRIKQLDGPGRLDETEIAWQWQP